MPVIICPGCSSQLKVPDGLSGKKAKCSSCQNTFLIPGPTAVRASSPPPAPPVPAKKSAPARPVPAKAPSRVVEDFDDFDELGDDSSRRPKKPSRRAREDDYDDDFDNEEEDRPRPKKGKNIKKKRGAPILLLSLVGGGAFLGLILICVLLWLFWPFGGATAMADLAYIPDNSDVVVSIQVADLMNSNAYQKVVKDIPQVATSLQMMKQQYGFDAKDITSILIGGQSKGNDGLAVFHTSVAMTPEKMLGNKKAKTTQVGSHTIHELDRKSAVCFINDRHFVAGDPDAIQKVLKRNGKAKLSSTLTSALGNLNTSSTVAMAMSTDILKNKGAGQIPGMNFPTGDWWSLEVQVGGNLQVTARGNFPDAKAAGDAKTALDGLLAIAKMNPGIPPDVLKMVNGLTLSTSGNQMVGKMTLEVDPLLQMAKKGGGFGGFPIGGIPGFGGGGNPFPPGGGGNPFPPGGGNPFPPGGGGFPGNSLKFTDFDTTANLPRNQELSYQVNLQANIDYQIDLESTAFDCYLTLKNSTGNVLRTDDDGGQGLNSRIRFRTTQPGNYTIGVQALGRIGGGTFRLQVRH